ncbi:primosomal protein N' [Nocardia sp. NPDC051030]|uniref:primosomal protein N' n=1 Tax=Nocardia sp. NPDC051030 TaxID=3155162 RepID=UPI00342B5A04
MARVLPLLEPAHLDRDFDYIVPPEMDEIAQPGVRVRVRFSGRLIDGYLLERLEKTDHTGKLVRLDRVVSPEQVLTPEILRLITAVATRYSGTRADVLRLAIPPRHARTEAEGKEPKPPRTKKRGKAAAVVSDVVDLDVVEDDSNLSEPTVVIDETAASDDPIVTSEGEAADITADTDEASAVEPELPTEQSISERYPGWGRYAHGVSFLTAVEAGRSPRAAWQALPGEDWARRLAELAATVVRSGRSAIVMVPDQRDLDRVLAECVALVGESAVGLSAGLGPSARYRRWLAALRGTARVVVGTRSAVFVPVHDLGLIALWDDGDDTYAEPRSPYPHAREVAMLRAHETGAGFLAAGFARTAEVQAVVESGWAHDLLAERSVLREAMPRISAPGDNEVAMERDPIARAVRIPGLAFLAARRALAAGESVLVQVPRRGYIPALSCAKCRTPARCRHCNGPLALPENSSGARMTDSTGGFRSVSARGTETAHSPACRWCGIVEAAFRCGACGSRALRAVVIGAQRTAEELGRAFPGVPVRGSGGASILDTVPEGPQVVVATIGAEPRVPGGYSVGLLLDGWALLGRADLRAAEDALRRWLSAAALVRPSGQVIVMADPALPVVQALVRWDPVGHAQSELDERTEVRFPPAVRLAAIDGTTDSINELLIEAKLPDIVEVLGPVPLPPGARKPFSGGDSPAEVERMILRVDRAHGAGLSRALAAAQAVRSTHKSDAPLRVQIDPIDIG